MVGKYFITNYIQKSRNFLYPLVSNQKFPPDKMNTYLMCDEIDEHILDFKIIVQLNNTIEVTDELFLKNVTNVYEQDDCTLYTLDISKWKDDVDAFLRGSYSQFSELGKKKILSYYNSLSPNGEFLTPEQTEKSKGMFHFCVFFFPHRYKWLVAKELCTTHELFETEEEALKSLTGMDELCEIYDLNKETLKL